MTSPLPAREDELDGILDGDDVQPLLLDDVVDERAMVVDLPFPVAPVTQTSPRRASAMVRMTGGRLSVSKSGIWNGMVRITAPQLPRCLKIEARKRETPGERVAPVHLAEVERREPRAGRLEHEVGDRLGVGVRERRVLRREQLAEDAVGRRVAHLEVDVARLPLHGELQERMEHLLAERTLAFHGGESTCVRRGPIRCRMPGRCRAPLRRSAAPAPRRGASFDVGGPRRAARRVARRHQHLPCESVRIAIVSTPFVPVPPPRYGGTELVVDALSRALVRAGHDVTVFATGDSRAPRRPRAASSAAVWPPDPYTELLHCRFAAARRSRRAASTWSTRTPLHAGLRRRAARAGRLHAAPRGRPVAHALLRAHPGRPSRRHLRRQAELSDPPAHAVVHHGLDPSLYPEPGQGGDEAFFLGRLSWCKAPELAIEAAGRAGLRIAVAGRIHAEDACPRGWRDDALAPALARGHVRWLRGADLRMKRRAFARSRALLVPLRWEEPFGLVMIEALLAGCPVIATPRGAAPEIVRDGEDGFLVRGVREMASALRRADRLDRRAIQARARAPLLGGPDGRRLPGRLPRRDDGPGSTPPRGRPRRPGGGMERPGALIARPEELLGYADPSEQPEATGVEKLVLKRGNLFLVANRLGDVAPAGRPRPRAVPHRHPPPVLLAARRRGRPAALPVLAGLGRLRRADGLHRDEPARGATCSGASR